MITPNQITLAQHVFDLFNTLVVVNEDANEQNIFQRKYDLTPREQTLYDSAVEALRLFITEEHSFNGRARDEAELLVRDSRLEPLDVDPSRSARTQ